MSLENYPSFLLNFSEREMNGEDKITAENKIGIRNFFITDSVQFGKSEYCIFSPSLINATFLQKPFRIFFRFR